MSETSDYWVRHYCGIAKARLGRWSEAESAFKNWQRKEPWTIDRFRRGGGLMQQRKFVEAKEVLDRAREKPDVDAFTLNDCAVAAIENRDLRGALRLLRRALRIDDACTVALNNAAVCYQLQGFKEKAKRLYLAALHTDPDCVSAVHNIAEAYILERDFGAAIGLLDEYRKRHPADMRVLERLAWAHGCLGSRDKAISLLREGVQISSEKIRRCLTISA